MYFLFSHTAAKLYTLWLLLAQVNIKINSKVIDKIDIEINETDRTLLIPKTN